jgi:LETM1-like protein
MPPLLLLPQLLAHYHKTIITYHCCRYVLQQLLGSDMQYAFALVTKAAQGYTLKPREVRTLRRSGKDLLTLIPTIIIIVLPLTPVGHVLIFSFIQRYFPDFFPSTYTERRQNLLKVRASESLFVCVFCNCSLCNCYHNGYEIVTDTYALAMSVCA